MTKTIEAGTLAEFVEYGWLRLSIMRTLARGIFHNRKKGVRVLLAGLRFHALDISDPANIRLEFSWGIFDQDGDFHRMESEIIIGV